MNLPKHTPGPWFVLPTGHCVGGPEGPLAGGVGIAMCGMRGRTPEEQEANARLTAMSPAMLKLLGEMREALRGLAESVEGFDQRQNLMMLAGYADNVILRATEGEQPL